MGGMRSGRRRRYKSAFVHHQTPDSGTTGSTTSNAGTTTIIDIQGVVDTAARDDEEAEVRDYARYDHDHRDHQSSLPSST